MLKIRYSIQARGLALAAALVFLGCAGATRFQVSVNSLAASPQPEGRRYLLVPEAADHSPSELQFQEFARAVEVGLAERGFERVDAAESAELVIAIAWRVGEPQTDTILYPRSAHSYFDPYVSRHRHTRHRAHHGDPYFSQFYRSPDYFPAGRTIHTVKRVLVLTASAIEPGKALRLGRPLWSTTVESRGGDDDLRRVFPVLVSAAVPHLATDSGQRIEAVVREDDERVVRIRAGQSSGVPARLTPVLEEEPEP